jgi:hypothetical protein
MLRCAAFLAAALALSPAGAPPDPVRKALARGDTAALREVLATRARTDSADAAALALAAALESEPRNREFRARLEDPATQDTDLAPARARYLFVMVPGWRYRVNRETGADLAQPRARLERLGFATVLVPLDENGAIDANARALAAEVARLRADGRALVLVSTSKGGPETHLALDILGRAGEAGHVAAWVNIGGLLNGSAIADGWAAWPRRWLAAFVLAFNGFDMAAIDSMTTAASRARFAGAVLPDHVLVVNYLGVPLASEVSPPARDGYAILVEGGPNDGLTLLADAIVPGGVTVVARGLDHFYAAPDLDDRIAAMGRAIVRRLEERAGR